MQGMDELILPVTRILREAFELNYFSWKPTVKHTGEHGYEAVLSK
jgi:hypothetical protein